MKSATKWILFSLAVLIAIPGIARSDSLTEILRTTALKNGLRPAAQLFDDTDAALAVVGKQFFKSKNVSLNGRMACRTCHLDQFGSGDGLPNAIGIFGEGEGPKRALSEGRIVPRNTLPLWGRGALGFNTFFWDGKVDFSDGKKISQFGAAAPSDDALVTAVHLPPAEIREMLNNDTVVSRHMRESPEKAAELYTQITKHLLKTERMPMEELARRVNKPMNGVTFHDVARSIAAFIRSAFRLKDTKFQKFVFGKATLNPDELKGGLIFYGKGKCVNCHNGPYYSDLKFHAVPFPQLGFGKNGFGVDYGRFNVTFQGKDLYRFRTPSLFNVHKTAPYGHAGSIANVRDAIVAHFDPLQTIDLESMDGLARHEFFKRMAATGKDFRMLSILNEREVAQVEIFLKTLSFE
jgi:cytochrome c peroxidase